jgi:transcriptional regulator with XRE-family HTH domain
MNVIELRTRLALTQSEFARLVGADTRSVAWWEAEPAKPSGGSRVVITALAFFLEKWPDCEVAFQFLMARYASLGGLAFMISDLMERMLTDGKTEKKQHAKKRRLTLLDFEFTF